MALCDVSGVDAVEAMFTIITVSSLCEIPLILDLLRGSLARLQDAMMNDLDRNVDVRTLEWMPGWLGREDIEERRGMLVLINTLWSRNRHTGFSLLVLSSKS